MPDADIVELLRKMAYHAEFDGRPTSHDALIEAANEIERLRVIERAHPLERVGIRNETGGYTYTLIEEDVGRSIRLSAPDRSRPVPES